MTNEMTTMTMSGAPCDLADSTLLAIASEPVSREVVLSFRNSVRLFSARATGVDELLVYQFFRQNVVDEVTTWGRDSDAGKLRDLLAMLLFERESAAEVIEPWRVARLDECVNAVLEDRKVLVELTPAFGAWVLLLAVSIEWSD
jgi:hypothetical protein